VLSTLFFNHLIPRLVIAIRYNHILSVCCEVWIAVASEFVGQSGCWRGKAAAVGVTRPQHQHNANCSTTRNGSSSITQINTHNHFTMNYLNNLIGRPFVSHQDEDVMTPAAASPPPSSPPSSMPPSSQIPGLDLLSAAQFDAQIAARKAASSPNTPANKRQRLDGTPTSSSSSTAPRTLLPTKPRGDSAAKVNDKCQLLHLRTDYEFEEGPPQAFSATLRLLDGDQELQSFEAIGLYPSKKAAKDKAAELALEWLEKQDVPKKAAKDAGLLPLAASKVDQSENWVGVLHGRSFCSAVCLFVTSGPTTRKARRTLGRVKLPEGPSKSACPSHVRLPQVYAESCQWKHYSYQLPVCSSRDERH